MNRILLLFLLAITIWSCDDSIKFEEPQPPNKNDLNQIPKQLRGTYFSTSDSTNLIINEGAIIEWTKIEVKTLIDSLEIEIDSTKIVEQTPDLIHVEDNYNLILSFISGDSVLVHYSYRDTIFEISEEHILRRFKGHYFLNYKKTGNSWKVRRLTLNNDLLSFSKVRLPKDIEELNEITDLQEIKSERGNVVGYKLNPTRKELKQLMKRSFSETKTYRKAN